jgi:hypothetical protein
MNHIQNYRVSMTDRGVETMPVYLCRCGVEHTGDYAMYDYGHHMCFHDAPLLNLGNAQVVCPDCGKDWRVEMRAEPALSWWEQIISYLQALYR